MLRRLLLLGPLLLVLVPVLAKAEGFGEAMDLAMRQYRDGAYGAAAATLQEAALLARRKKATALRGFLPTPPTGWTVRNEPDPTGGVKPAVGVAVERAYTSDAKTITIAIVTDSPLVDIVGVNFTRATYAHMHGQRPGGLKGVRSLIRYQSGRRAGEMNILVDKRILVVARGTQVDQDDLIAFAQRIDYPQLKRIP